MSKNKPLVTILITTYNRPEYLDKCLASVISQDFKDYEIIVIDDCSTAETDAVIKKYEVMPNLHHIKNKQNLGFPKCLNKGISLAKGNYIAILDDDDQWIDSTKLGQQVIFLETHPDYVLVGTGVVIGLPP